VRQADEFFYRRELEGDPILVPYPLTFAGETRGGHDTPLSASTYDAARTPNVTAFVHGQWRGFSKVGSIEFYLLNSTLSGIFT
jgi:hypothetical protein